VKTEVSGKELSDHIDDWLKKNTIKEKKSMNNKRKTRRKKRV
jgi:hypothetical protein